MTLIERLELLRQSALNRDMAFVDDKVALAISCLVNDTLAELKHNNRCYKCKHQFEESDVILKGKTKGGTIEITSVQEEGKGGTIGSKPIFIPYRRKNEGE